MAEKVKALPRVEQVDAEGVKEVHEESRSRLDGNKRLFPISFVAHSPKSCFQASEWALTGATSSKFRPCRCSKFPKRWGSPTRRCKVRAKLESVSLLLEGSSPESLSKRKPRS